MEYNGLNKLFDLYKNDVDRAKLSPLTKSYFYTVWRQVMNKGVVDPDTGVKYCTLVRVNHCRGFAQCTTCEILAADMARTTDTDERECYRRALAEHQEQVVHNYLVHSRFVHAFPRVYCLCVLSGQSRSRRTR